MPAMNIDFFGLDQNYFGNAFFDDTGAATASPTSGSATQIVLVNSYNGNVTTIDGTGFTFDAGTGEVTGGTMTSITFVSGASTLATFTNISWSAVDASTAIYEMSIGNIAPMLALFSAQTINYDGSTASVGVDVSDFQGMLTSVMNVTGSAHNDVLDGGTNNDTLNPLDNSDYDTVLGSTGNNQLSTPAL